MGSEFEPREGRQEFGPGLVALEFDSREWVFATVEAIGNHLHAENLDLGKRVVFRCPVGHHAWNVDHDGKPAAIVFAAEFNVKHQTERSHAANLAACS